MHKMHRRTSTESIRRSMCVNSTLTPTPLLIAATETSSGEVTPPFVCDTVHPMHHHSIVKFVIPTGCEASDAACDGCMSNSGPTLQSDLRWTHVECYKATFMVTCLHCGSVNAESDSCPDVHKGRSIDRCTLRHTNSAFYAECGADYEVAFAKLEELTLLLRRFM